MQYEVEALDHGAVFVQFTDASLDYGADDHVVDDQMKPEEALELGFQLVKAAFMALAKRSE